MIGFGYTNAAVTGEFFPSPTYTQDDFLRDFIAENSTLPQVTSYLTAPATKAEHDNAKNERVKVISPVFKAPKQEPDKNGTIRTLPGCR